MFSVAAEDLDRAVRRDEEVAVPRGAEGAVSPVVVIPTALEAEGRAVGRHPEPAVVDLDVRGLVDHDRRAGAAEGEPPENRAVAADPQEGAAAVARPTHGTVPAPHAVEPSIRTLSVATGTEAAPTVIVAPASAAAKWT